MFKIIQGDSFELSVTINDGNELIDKLVFTSAKLNVFDYVMKQNDNVYTFEMTSEETKKLNISNATYSVEAHFKDDEVQTIILNEPILIKLKDLIVNYITKDDFLKFSGKDLDLEFKNGNYDIKEPVPMFIKRVETVAIELLKDRYDNDNIEEKINRNLDKFKEGMCWQINHILDNSELYLSEFDKSKYLNDIAITIWRNIGLCNLRRYGRTKAYGKRYEM